MSAHVLFIDNFDSFSFNLVDELRKRDAEVEVWRNDIAAEEAIDRALALPSPRLLVLSPGPGRPEDAGCTQPLVSLAAGRIPTFGVCLGMQAIVQALGGTVVPAGDVVHGKAVWITHEESGLFRGLPSPLLVGRYHSLVAQELPPELRVTAHCNGLTMAVEHTTAAILGVQFHPESVLTRFGGAMIDRLLDWAGTHGR